MCIRYNVLSCIQFRREKIHDQPLITKSKRERGVLDTKNTQFAQIENFLKRRNRKSTLKWVMPS